MSKDVADTVLSIIEGHCWTNQVQESEGRAGVIGFNAGRNAALGEVADLIRQLRQIYKIVKASAQGGEGQASALVAERRTPWTA